MTITADKVGAFIVISIMSLNVRHVILIETGPLATGLGMVRGMSGIATEQGSVLLSGNEILVRGAIEAGAQLLSGYPGSPLAEVFDIVHQNREYLASRGIRGSLANNEAQGVAMLGGAMDVGARAVSFMKSVGLHVASDPLFVVHCSGTGPKVPGKPGGGNVICVGDDPWNLSTQVPADSRFLFRHMMIPVVEPSSLQQMKDFLKKAMELSDLSDGSVGYIVSTHQAESGGLVECGPVPVHSAQKAPIITANIDLAKRIAVPPNTAPMEVELVNKKFPRILKGIRQLHLNSVQVGQMLPDTVIISSGLALQHVKHVLALSGTSVSVAQLGCTYPLDPQFLSDLAARYSRWIIVEEKRSFIQEQVESWLFQQMQQGLHASVKVLGKSLPDGQEVFPSTLGLNPFLVIEGLVKVGRFWALDADVLRRWSQLTERMSQATMDASLAKRPPTFCPGCPHRETMAAIKQVKAKSGEDVFTHGDVGCYSLSFLPPFHEMHNFSAMGYGGSTASGTDKFINNKQVVMMGDSTFFHTGMVNISHSIKEGQNILYLILDNKNTAMTGHQPTPADGYNLMGDPVPAQDIEQICRGLNPQMMVKRLRPSDRNEYVKIMDQALALPGTKVIIADKECGITFHSKEKAKKRQVVKHQGFLPHEEFINVTPEVCENCRECTIRTGCPGLTTQETDYGEKIQIDLGVCVTDTYCTTFKVCPSFEKVIVERQQAPLPVASITIPSLPEPMARPLADRFQVVIAGIGGTGVTSISAWLSAAAQSAGYYVQWVDQKGLAQRNGAVSSFVTVTTKDSASVWSTVVPQAQADLLLGVDLLEAGRSTKYCDPDRTLGVVNMAKTPTTPMIMGREQFPADAHRGIEARCAQFYGENFMTIAQEYLGNRIFANVMMVGVALQKGFLPFTVQQVEQTLAEQTRTREPEKNQMALKLGRALALYSPEEIGLKKPAESWESFKKEAAEYIRWSNPWRATSMVRHWESCLQIIENQWSPDLHRTMAVRIRDLIAREGQGLKYLERWSGWGGLPPEVQKDLIAIDAYVSLIKDEVWVANLLVSPIKLKRDREQYRLGPQDKIKYLHLNRPHFDLGPWKIEFDLETKNWMLQILRHGRWLRRLLPKWHQREKEYRDWVQQRVLPWLQSQGPTEVKLVASEILKANGYREIRYPKMKKVEEMVTSMMNGKGKVVGGN